MKRLSKYIVLLLFSCFLTGCSGKDTPPTVDYDLLTDIPVLSIETNSTASDVMDFVTKPVTTHVAESIASWTPDYVMPPAPYYEACTVSLTDTDKTILLDSVNAEVKVRGNWTTSYEKKPLRIKFEEAQNLLGLNGGATFKNWLLLAEYKDASMLRNKTALSIAQELLGEDGLYVADATFVEVVINGQYWGVYLLTEQQQINSDRVNITEAEKGYTGTDIGYFMELDGYYMHEDALQHFHVDYADNAALIPYDGNDGSGRTMKCLSDPEYGRKNDIGITIKSDIYSQEQHDFIASYINNVYYIMYAAAYQGEAYVFSPDYAEIFKSTHISPQEAVEQVVDVQSLVDTYILNELLCDADIYWSSFYMTVDFGQEGNKKLTFEAPWDFDSAMGNKNRCTDGIGFYASNIVPDVNGGPKGDGEYETINPWLVVLAYEDWYQELIRENWTQAYDSGVFERAYAMIETDQAQCSEAFARNYEKWNNIMNKSSFESELSWQAAACDTQKEAATLLLEWLQSRVTFLNEQWHS